MLQVFGKLSQFHLIADEESLEVVLTAWYILPSTRRMGQLGGLVMRTQEEYMTRAENLHWPLKMWWLSTEHDQLCSSWSTGTPVFMSPCCSACKENQLGAVKFEWQNAEKTAAGSRVCWNWAVWGLRDSLKWGCLLSFSFPPVVGGAAQHLKGFLVSGSYLFRCSAPYKLNMNSLWRSTCKWTCHPFIKKNILAGPFVGDFLLP